MTERRRPGLGRGLSALLEDVGNSSSPEQIADASRGASRVAISRVVPNPRQPRRRFDAAAQSELVDSVREKGLLQPILVRPLAGGKLEIVAGERRWRAAQAAQLHEVPVVVRDLGDAEAFELALIENIQREDLSPVEEARGFRHLIDEFGHTQERVAEMVGKSRSHVANLMRLLDLPETVLDMVDDGRLGMGHARALLGSSDPEGLAKRIVAEGLTARDAESLGKAAKTGRKANSRKEVDADVAALETRIREATGLKTSLKHGQRGGQLTLSYSTLEQLDDIIARLGA